MQLYHSLTHFVCVLSAGLGVGVMYGTTSVCVGHPFDTIKTKMQAQRGYETGSMFRSFSKTVREQGVRGLYRGAIPPLLGSGLFRSTQFAVFEAVYTSLDIPFGRYELPGTAGLQVRVCVGAFIASTARAVIETPLEYAKVRRQTLQSWQFRHLYTGWWITWARTVGLMCTYFILVDSGRRHAPHLFTTPVVGPFLTSGVAATLAWWLVWPLEYMKSQVQGSYGRQQSVLQRMRTVVSERGGFFALYRGLGPGTIRSFLANGCSMIVMQHAQRKVSQWGLRD